MKTSSYCSKQLDKTLSRTDEIYRAQRIHNDVKRSLTRYHPAEIKYTEASYWCNAFWSLKFSLLLHVNSVNDHFDYGMKTLSWANRALSSTNIALSWVNIALSFATKALSWANRALSWANRALSWSNKALSWANRFLSWANRALLWTS